MCAREDEDSQKRGIDMFLYVPHLDPSYRVARIAQYACLIRAMWRFPLGSRNAQGVLRGRRIPNQACIHHLLGFNAKPCLAGTCVACACGGGSA